MLSGQASDPDVERLLEGTAFLSGLLQQKIDDHLPEVIHSLTNFIFPHLLKAIPSVTIVRFAPRKGLQESLKISTGTKLGARPVQEVSALFQTCFDCLVQPLEITEINGSGSAGQGQQIEISFELTGPGLDSWIPDPLPFFLGGSYSRASDIFYLLTRKLRRIVVESEDGSTIALPAKAVQPTAFQRKSSLLPYSDNSFSGYRHLQEFFLLPHKFLFLELTGLNGWQNRGKGTRFKLRFEFESASISLPKMSLDSFLLSTVPAINLFSHEAEPVVLDHTTDKIRIIPALQDGKRPEIYSVESVTGYTRGAMTRKEYIAASRFSTAKDANIFSLNHSISPVHNRPQLALQFAYPSHASPLVEETLSMELLCTNGDIPQQLKPGDICQATSSTPELVDFSNLMKPTLPIDPPLAGNVLWQLLSHLSLNLLSLASVENLVELLNLYIFQQDRDRGRISSNKKRVQGIEEFTVQQTNKLVRGQMMRGQKITVVARSDFFASLGDFCLFSMVLDNFFSEYCSLNTFTQLDMTDSVSGETYAWATRIGSRPLI